MTITITKRPLNDREVELLIEEIKKFPNLVAGNKRRWQKLEQIYVATLNKEFVGVYGITTFHNWYKIGPFVVLEKYQGKGYGKTIIENIVKDYSNVNLLTISRTPAVWKIMTHFSFQEVSLGKLPYIAKMCLIHNILQLLSIDTIKELLRKRSAQEEPYHYFVRRTKPIFHELS